MAATENSILKPFSQEEDLNRAIEKSGNAVRDGIISKAWNAVKTVAGSGFGKGFLLAAAALVVVPAVVMGGFGLIGSLTATQGTAQLGVLGMAQEGAMLGLNLFTHSPVGWVIAGIGGGVNAGRAKLRQEREEQERLEAAAMREREREMQKEKSRGKAEEPKEKEKGAEQDSQAFAVPAPNPAVVELGQYAAKERTRAMNRNQAGQQACPAV